MTRLRGSMWSLLLRFWDFDSGRKVVEVVVVEVGVAVVFNLESERRPRPFGVESEFVVVALMVVVLVKVMVVAMVEEVVVVMVVVKAVVLPAKVVGRVAVSAFVDSGDKDVRLESCVRPMCCTGCIWPKDGWST